MNATTSKSEEKKCSSSVNNDYQELGEHHRSSPSFYINDVSEEEGNEGNVILNSDGNEGEVPEDDLAKEPQHNNYVPASSFASGA